MDGQIGLEQTPDEYVSRLVDVFREVKRVLRDDGTVWLNLGDSYNGTKKGNTETRKNPSRVTDTFKKMRWTELESKQLLGIPWRVAFALQADGWILRQDIIWAKPNPMPESVTDRCTKSHEYLFHFSKSARYYYDAKAIKEKAIYGLHGKEHRPPGIVRDRELGYQSKESVLRGRVVSQTENGITIRHPDEKRKNDQQSPKTLVDFRNRRSVWTIPTKPFKGSHFAVMPEALVEPCILAGTKRGDTVLDPFAGCGTVGAVCKHLGRSFIGIDLNPTYCEMARKRIEDTPKPML